MKNQHLNFGVVTVSDRSARGEREDISGRAARDLLESLGSVVASSVVPDGIEPVQQAVRDCVVAGAQIVITTGGTGITSRDCTPQAIVQILSYEIPGLPELIRAQSKVATAALTRSIAGVLEISKKRACVICLPGSPGGVVEGITILQPFFEHIAGQLADSDHAPTIWNHDHTHADAFAQNTNCQDSGVATNNFATHESITRKLAKLPPVEDNAAEIIKARLQSGESDAVSADHATAALVHSDTDGVESNNLDASAAIARIQDEKISMEELDLAVRTDRAGATLSFSGRVRNHDGGRAVAGIEYVAHPSAPDALKTIADEIAQINGICGVAVIHRFGHLQVGEIALGVTISAEHRHEAYRAMETLIDRVKMELPVWKRQEFIHGESQWSGMV